MPILKKVPAYQDGDGVLHTTIAAWQRAELIRLLSGAIGNSLVEAAVSTVDLILAHPQDVVSILTTGPTSRPSARKRAGTTSPKRAAKRATEAQAKDGFRAMRQATEGGGTNGAHDADVPAPAEAA